MRLQGKFLIHLSLFACLLVPFGSCAQKSFDEQMKRMYRGTVPLIMSEDVPQHLGDSVILLDVRTPVEFETSHLPGATFIDYDSFRKSDVKDLPKDAHVIVYCAVGYRSERIGEKLQKMGFSNVDNLYGGIFDWKYKDYEVINKNGVPTDSVHTYNADWSKWLRKGIKVY